MGMDMTTTEQFLAAERARLTGTQGYSVEEFKNNMRSAIKKEQRRMNDVDIDDIQDCRQSDVNNLL